MLILNQNTKYNQDIFYCTVQHILVPNEMDLNLGRALVGEARALSKIGTL